MAENEQGFPEMLRIICSIISRPESFAFREPVDWQALGLVDYLDIVKMPMDLGTIKKKIEYGHYECVEDIANDVRLVWSNCMLYNRDGSEYYHLADTFARAFEEAYSAFRRLEDSRSDFNRIPTLDEKMQLSYDIFKIDNVEMARCMTIIETSCPNALSKEGSVDEVLINLDALNPQCFHEVNAYVLSCIVQRSGGGKKKKRTNASTVLGGGGSSSSSSSLLTDGKTTLQPLSSSSSSIVPPKQSTKKAKA